MIFNANSLKINICSCSVFCAKVIRSELRNCLRLEILTIHNDYPQIVQLQPIGYILSRIAGCAILVTFIWNRRCHSVILWARWGVPMEAFPFHWDPQLAPQIFRLGGWGCRWMSRDRQFTLQQRTCLLCRIAPSTIFAISVEGADDDAMRSRMIDLKAGHDAMCNKMPCTNCG